MGIERRIKEARLAKNLSINALANKVGVSSTAAWNWDHGYTTPRPEMVDKIARALNIDAHFLRTGKESTEEKRSNSTETVSDIITDAKIRLAAATGISVDQIRLELKLAD